jgi:hypothetical protein
MKHGDDAPVPRILMLKSDYQKALAAANEQIAKLTKERDAEREQCRKWITDIMGHREYEGCWFNDEGDCGNWPECSPHCPLKQMRDHVGIVPQTDGGLDKQ